MLTEWNYVVCSLSPGQGMAEPGIQTLTKKPEFLTTMLRQSLFFHACGIFWELYWMVPVLAHVLEGLCHESIPIM